MARQEFTELRVLHDNLFTSAISAGGSSSSVASELQAGERAEVVAVEIFPPIASGTPEILDYVTLVIDDDEKSKYTLFSGTDQRLTAPPAQNELTKQWLALGIPLINLGNSNGLLNTCPKVTKKIGVRAYAGTGGISANFRVRVWGIVYREDDLPLWQSRGQIPTTVSLRPYVDPYTGVAVPISRDVAVNFDKWQALPGGWQQTRPTVLPLVRYCENNVASTGGQPFEPRYGAVTSVRDSREDMYFVHDDGDDALILTRFGIRTTSDNLAQAMVRIGGYDHPRGRFPTTRLNNPLQFGWSWPRLPNTLPTYDVIPKLHTPQLIYKETGFPSFVDAGGSSTVAANTTHMAIAGIYIEGLL